MLSAFAKYVVLLTVSIYSCALRAMGRASNCAQWKKLSGLTDKRWAALSRKQRAAFIHDTSVARGVLGGHASNEAQGQALSKLDDESWALFAQRERDAFITAAASERGDAINEAQGQAFSKLDDAEWALLAQTQHALCHADRVGYLRKAQRST